ncbi:alpha/beta hydrolase fold-3 domain-containing protein [Xylariales sp. PMI_506]|nr:alpha/beta hydrolase fold-3 domain-containing protein [Xylariales sp. PMI_506]
MARSQSWPLVSYQPLRLIYQLYYLGTVIPRLPLWLVAFILFPSLRHRRSWTATQALRVCLVKWVVDLQSRVGISDPISQKPGKEKQRFQSIPPFPQAAYKGPLSSREVSPAMTGGTWFPNPIDGKNLGPKSTIVLHIHGGAFVIGDGRTDQIGFLADSLIQHGGVDAVFSLQYRLSGYKKTNPFPAALQDVVTGYLYLVRTLSIPPQQITVSGDSAGGNLAIAFLRYLSEFGEAANIPKPQSTVLISPWVSPANALGPEVAITSNPQYSTDFLPPSFLRWGAQTYSAITAAADPYISPLGYPFKSEVPIFINQGSVELLEVDGTQWTKEMQRVEGNDIQSEYEEGAPHDTLLCAVNIGWTESAAKVATKIGAFIRNHQQAL